MSEWLPVSPGPLDAPQAWSLPSRSLLSSSALNPDSPRSLVRSLGSMLSWKQGHSHLGKRARPCPMCTSWCSFPCNLFTEINSPFSPFYSIPFSSFSYTHNVV